MKLSLVLLLVIASVALFRAEVVPEDVEELTNDEDSSVSFLYDGSMEDEVLGDEEDPADKAKKEKTLSLKGEKRVCARVFMGCLIKTKARCKLVPVCKVKYFACRCIIRGVRKCKKFLHFVSVMVKKHKGRKHDEEIAEDEEEDPKKKRISPAVLKVCKAGYRKCSKGKTFCGKCLKGFGACVRKGSKPKPAKKADEEEEEEHIMADAVENDDEGTEDEEDEEDPSGPSPSGRPRPSRRPRPSGGPRPSGRPRPHKKLLRCAKFGVKCMLRARLDCRRQGICVRILKKCVRHALHRPRPSPSGQ